MATSKNKKPKTKTPRSMTANKAEARQTREQLEHKEVASVEAARTDAPLTSGPRKRRVKGVPEPRLTHHKARSSWFQARTTWPVREAPVQRLVQQRAQAEKTLASPTAGAAQWESAGPSNIGGRMTCIVCHPAHPERIWAGAAGGGVWQSTDAGQTWQSFWNDQDVLNIGALAIDANNPDTLYCGTGEANLSADSYPGVGLYKSTDAGRSWHLLASSDRTGLPRRIGVIAVDPFDSSHLLIGGVGFGEVSQAHKDFGGLYVSSDGGVTWARHTFISENNYWCHAVVFHPKKRGIIYATMTERGMRNGIWRSTNGGKTWQHLTSGLPEAGRFGRTSLAISPSSPDVLYAFAQDEASGNSDLLLGVFRTANGGDTWKSVSGRHFAEEGQISYGNTIAVHPTDPNFVICGGVDLHLTKNAGKTWRQVTHWDANRGDPDYAHADHHGLLMPAAVPGRIYDPNDGGLDMSDNGGRTWTNRSNGLPITMFYDFDMAQSNGLIYGGGAQDNGTVITTDGASSTFFELLGGDGGWIVFDPNDAGHVYASYYNLSIYRFRGDQYADVSPPATKAERNSIWMAYIAMDPSNSNRVFTGSSRVWRTKDDGNNWTAVSAPLDGSPITAIDIAVANPQRVTVGTENGGIYRSLNGGDSWGSDISGATLPGHTITRIVSHPKDANRLYVTVANFGHSHVFRSNDGGVSWEDVDRGQLPDVPHHVVLIRPDELNRVYVGNDAGVYVFDEPAGTWANLTKNLPNAMVIDLVYHLKDGMLNAATYGRSVWRLRLK